MATVGIKGSIVDFVPVVYICIGLTGASALSSNMPAAAYSKLLQR